MYKVARNKSFTLKKSNDKFIESFVENLPKLIKGGDDATETIDFYVGVAKDYIDRSAEASNNIKYRVQLEDEFQGYFS